MSLLDFPDLHLYQRRAARDVVDHLARALFIDMGLGKTLIVLTGFGELVNRFLVERALIIAPRRVCYTTWPDEIEKWAHVRHLRYVNLHENIDNYKQPADLYAINPASLHKIFGKPIWRKPKKGGRKYRVWQPGIWQTWQDRPEMLIVDESTQFKNSTSLRSKMIRRFVNDFPRRVIMTGTPAPNGEKDLYGQMLLVDKGETLGATKTAFEEEFCDIKQKRISGGRMIPDAVPRDDAFDEIMERVRPYATVLEGKDHLELPERVDVDIPVPLPDHVMQIYHQALDEAGAVLEGGKTLFARGGAGAKLRQIANGLVYVDDPLDETREIVELHNAKLEALDEVVEGTSCPILLAYEFKSDGNRLFKHLRWPIIRGGVGDKEVKKLQDAWNAGKLPGLIVQPTTINYGVNIQFAGNEVLWYGLIWQPEVYQQFNGRVDRQGQRSSHVFIRHLVARGTSDERVVKVLQMKRARQSHIVAALKEEIAERAQAR